MKTLELLKEMLENSESDEERVSSLLKVMGFKPSLLGFEYIKQSVLLLLKEKHFYNVKITFELYPEVAKICDTTSASRVERGIRHAIEELLKRRKTLNIDKQKVIFYVLGVDISETLMCNSDWLFAITRFIKEGNWNLTM